MLRPLVVTLLCLSLLACKGQAEMERGASPLDQGEVAQRAAGDRATLAERLSGFCTETGDRLIQVAEESAARVTREHRTTVTADSILLRIDQEVRRRPLDAYNCTPIADSIARSWSG